MEIADETKFVINKDNRKNLGFMGDTKVKYADLVSSGEPISMMVRISGGPRAAMHPPMLIFKNQSRSYHIRGEEDKVEGVCYRTSPKDWMEAKVWNALIRESREISDLPKNHQRTLFIENFSSHVLHDDVEVYLGNIKTTLRKLPLNATKLEQPADYFIFQKI